MVAALVSILTDTPARADLAMTGEITLSGHVLPVGGIKEKLLAAHRYGIKEVIIPKLNEKAMLEDLPAEIRKEMKIHLAGTLDEVLPLVFPALSLKLVPPQPKAPKPPEMRVQ
jgi:ATP-dependent Lon protease